MALTVKRDAAPTSEMKDDAQTTETVTEVKESAASVEVTRETTSQVDEQEPQAAAASADAGDEAGEIIEGSAELVSQDAQDESQAHQAGAVNAADVASPSKDATALAVSKGTAVTAASTVVSGAASSVFKKMIEELAAEGQEGLEMGYGVFPMLSMDKGEFKLGDEDIGDDAFRGVPLYSVPKFAYRTTGVSDKEVEAVFADSDQEHLVPGSAVAERLREWKQKWPDSGFDIKKYQNVYFYLTDIPAKPEMAGQLVVLSVSPQSIKHYTRATLFAKSKGYAAHECVFEALVGEKVRGDFDFYPWDFKCLGSCKKFGVEVTFGSKRDEDF